jgi:glycosyltransferase involved in cell wall biosynthesis
MKKLFFLIPTLEGGGAEKVLVDLVNKLDKQKYDITIKTLLYGGVNERRLNPNVNYYSIIRFKNKFVRKVLFYFICFIMPSNIAYKMIVRRHYDIEISYLQGITTKIMAAVSNKKAKKIAFIHTDLSSNYSLSKVYKTYNDCLNSYKHFDTVVFVSDKAKQGFEKLIGNLPSSLVLKNVVDVKSIINLSHEIVNEVKKESFLFVSVGRLSNEKGYDRLLDAASRLNEENFSFDIWIIGEGNEREKLEKLISIKNLHNVKLLGFKDNPYKYMKKADMFICSSRVEGYSTVVSEALILGIPVLTTDCAGMDEILENGRYGLVVENTTDGILAGMKKILSDSQVFKKYSDLAIKRSNYFTMEKSIKEYERLFDDKEIRKYQNINE